MESKIQVKEFLCPIHSSEPIKRVYKNSNANKLLFCLECIMESSGDMKSHLVGLDSLIVEIYNSIFNAQGFKINTKPSESMLSVLQDQDALISKFTEHILKQKEKVYSQTKKIEELLIESLHQSRDKLINTLDLQLATFKKNFEDYRNKLKKHFDFEDERDDSSMKTKEHLVSEINNCRSAADFEVKLKSYLIEMEEVQSFTKSQGEDQEMALLEGMKNMKEEMIKMSKTLPQACINIEEDFTKETKALLSSLEKYYSVLAKIKEPVDPLTMSSNGSGILKSNDLKNLIELCFSDKSSLKLKPLGKCSGDMANIEEVYNLSKSNDKEILVVIKTSDNQILGAHIPKNSGNNSTGPFLGGFGFVSSPFAGQNTSGTKLPKTFNLSKKLAQVDTYFGGFQQFGYYSFTTLLSVFSRDSPLWQTIHNPNGFQKKEFKEKYLVSSLLSKNVFGAPQWDSIYGVEELEVLEILN